MKVTVVGGSGYIGTRLIRHLTEQGHEYLNVDVRPSPSSVVHGRGPETLDIRRWESLDMVRDLKYPVVYLAGIHETPEEDRKRWSGVAEELMVNTPHVLAVDLPLLYVSSTRVLTAKPHTLYSRMKEEGEKGVFMSGGSVVRLGTVYGGLEGGLPNRTRTVPNHYILTGEEPDENWRAYVTSMDHALRAIQYWLEWDQDRRRVLNIVDCEGPLTRADLVSRISRVLHAPGGPVADDDTMAQMEAYYFGKDRI